MGHGATEVALDNARLAGAVPANVTEKPTSRRGEMSSGVNTARRTLRAWRSMRRSVPPTLLLAGWLAGWLACCFSVRPGHAEPRHGIAMHGEPLKPAGFAHFDYVRADAPKGGVINLGQIGSFDSLNPFIVRGAAAGGMRELVVESLMARALDEPFSLYALLAESVDVPADRSSVSFTVDARARFSDGKPVTAADVIFSHALLRDKGRPNLRTYYRKAQRVERVGERTVRFVFADGRDRELPLILGLMPILPRHSIDAATFDQSTLRPLVGSGPYVVAKVDPGRKITFRRDAGYWGRDLPVNRGRFNFDEIGYEYARDGASLFESFKTGAVDLRSEDDPVAWHQSYDFPAARDGRVRRVEIEVKVPPGMTALALNTRRPMLADPRVRRALVLLFDFEWIVRTLYNGAYVRTESYFARSDLASTGKAVGEAESAILTPLLAGRKTPVAASLLDGTWRLPVSDGTGRNRANARRALALLAEAGFERRGRQLVRAEDGTPLALEMLAATRGQERLMLAYARSLELVGISAKVRQVDSAQFQRRRTSFDFDIVQWTWGGSLSPGNEQLHRWSSRAAAIEGSFNLPGATDPTIDAAIAALLAADERPQFAAAVRALDRLLLAGDYVVPLFHAPRQWIAHWHHLAKPERQSLYGYQLDTWWSTAPRRDR